MSVQENEAVVQRWIQLQNEGRLDLLEEVLTPVHAQQYREGNALFQRAFPGYQQTIEDMISDGDKVVSRMTMRGVHRGEFLGIAPTGKDVTFEVIAIDRLEEGKVTESWEIGDILGLLIQLGAISLPIRGEALRPS
jgi:predicted ester cyclase